MPVDVVVGAQYGGEGKGKISAYLAATTAPKALLRCGGPNSGHQVVDDGINIKLRMIPTGAYCTRCLSHRLDLHAPSRTAAQRASDAALGRRSRPRGAAERPAAAV